ncbi:FAD/NAD(P)-binding domain-containing protein, partial [Punctularia strigosozonata HHB-11173 SS5]|uniref:FAD/NAD(P)-binding domain-containing protein n=1 Tax=Punctularia strigosozonata (strain HHB-11173) TaxID=741275 RepID=UPI00044185A0
MLFLCSFLLFSTSLAAVYDDVSSLPQKNCDFVIIGGGTSGLVVTNRLSEDPRVSVLVLEAGLSNWNVLNSEVPFLTPRLWGSQYDCNYTTVPQPGLNNCSVTYGRGKLLGGSSSINSMAYTRGSDDDWNKYAGITGDPGWSWEGIQLYIRKARHLLSNPSRFDPRYDPAFHSDAGPLQVSLTSYFWPSTHRVIQTTEELPSEFPYNLDVNCGDPSGIAWIQATIGNGTRSSAATAYLNDDFAAQPNLCVLIHAHATEVNRVTRLTSNNREFGQPVFDSVEFASSADGSGYNVTARRRSSLPRVPSTHLSYFCNPGGTMVPLVSTPPIPSRLHS